MEVARQYIERSHGSVGKFDPKSLKEILADDIVVENEEQHFEGADALLGVFQGWSDIVEPGTSAVIVKELMTDGGKKVLAHWETSYDTTSTATFYDGSPVPERKVRGFCCFAVFEIDGGKVKRVTQRTDSARRHLGIK